MSLLNTKLEYPRLERRGALRRAGPRWLLRGGILALVSAGALWWWLGGSPTVSDAPPAIGEGPGVPENLEEAEGGSGAEFQGSLEVALEAAEPYVKDGFTIREDHWGGEIARGEEKAIPHQLFKGNEYWIWLGSEAPHAVASVHVYDSAGKLVDLDSWQRGATAAARVAPVDTGKYYFVIHVTSSSEAPSPWGLAYGHR